MLILKRRTVGHVIGLIKATHIARNSVTYVPSSGVALEQRWTSLDPYHHVLKRQYNYAITLMNIRKPSVDLKMACKAQSKQLKNAFGMRSFIASRNDVSPCASFLAYITPGTPVICLLVWLRQEPTTTASSYSITSYTPSLYQVHGVTDLVNCMLILTRRCQILTGVGKQV